MCSARQRMYFWNKQIRPETVAMEASPSTHSRDKWKPGSAPSVCGAEHETEGLEEDMQSPLYDPVEKALESSMDSYSDTTTIPSPSTSRSSTFASSFSTITSPDSPVGQYSQHDAAFEDVLPFMHPLGSHRANTWPQVTPQSNHDDGVPTTSSNVSSTTRDTYRMTLGPMVKGYPGFIEGSNALYNNQSRVQSQLQDQPPPGRHSPSLGQGSADHLLYPQSSGKVSDEILLPASTTSITASSTFGFAKDPAILSGPTKPLVEYELPVHVPGINQNQADPVPSPCEWAEYWKNIHGSWQTESLEPCKFPSPQKLPLLLSHIRKHSKQGRTLSRRQKDHQVTSKSHVNTTASEGPQGEMVKSNLGMHLTSPTSSMLDSKASVNPADSGTSGVTTPAGAPPPQREMREDCNSGEFNPANQKGEESR